MRTLTEALEPLLEEGLETVWRKVKEEYLQASEAAMDEMWRAKPGLEVWNKEADKLHEDLLRLMRSSLADWTITWRQLAACAEVQGTDMESIFKPLVSAQS